MGNLTMRREKISYAVKPGVHKPKTETWGLSNNSDIRFKVLEIIITKQLEINMYITYES